MTTTTKKKLHFYGEHILGGRACPTQEKFLKLGAWILVRFRQPAGYNYIAIYFKSCENILQDVLLLVRVKIPGRPLLCDTLLSSLHTMWPTCHSSSTKVV